MAHLCISKHISKNKLVSLYKKYKSEYEQSQDKFEKAEIGSFIDTLYDFCVFRGGLSYWQSVVNEATNV